MQCLTDGAMNSRVKLLNNGADMPLLGMGTYFFEAPAGSSLDELVHRGLVQFGYRHLDCAHAYNNEDQVGKGLRRAMEASGIKRSAQ